MSEPAPWAPITATGYDALAAALAARREHLRLSYRNLDELCNFCAGQAEKYLGPSRTKGMGAPAIEVLMQVLGVDFIIVPNDAKIQWTADRAARSGHGYDVRLERAVRRNHPISMRQFERMKPLLFRHAGSLGGTARAAMLSPMQRSKIASKAARAMHRAKRAKRQNSPHSPT